MERVLASAVPAPVSLQTFRVTVVGDKESEKTSLITAFVNNFCPTVSVAPEETTLYYKTVEISANSFGEGPFPVLVEIEDTVPYDSDKRTDVLRSRPSAAKLCAKCREERETKGREEHSQGGSRADERAVAHKCQACKDVDGGSSPFKHVEASNLGKKGGIGPITPGQMAFLVVFEASSEKSWRNARDLLQALREKRRASPEKEIVVCLVANSSAEVALDPSNGFVSEAEREVDSLRQYFAVRDLLAPGEGKDESSDIFFKQVQAAEIQKVRRLFRNVLTRIHRRESLWRKEAPEDGGGFMLNMWNTSTPNTRATTKEMTPSTTAGPMGGRLAGNYSTSSTRNPSKATARTPSKPGAYGEVGGRADQQCGTQDCGLQ